MPASPSKGGVALKPGSPTDRGMASVPAGYIKRSFVSVLASPVERDAAFRLDSPNKHGMASILPIARKLVLPLCYSPSVVGVILKPHSTTDKGVATVPASHNK